MRIVSEETRITMNTRRNFVNYAHVTLHDGTELNLTPSDFRISGNSFTDDWNDGEAFQLGSAIGKTATLLLDNTDGRVEDVYTLQTSEPSDWSTDYTNYFTYFDFEYFPVTGSSAPTWEENTYYTKTTVTYPHGKFSNYDFYMSYFELKVVFPKSHHEDGKLVSTELFIGTFTVTTPASHGATVEITGVDNMYMFDKSFNDCTLNFSGGQTLYTILRRCCTDCGVAIGFSSFLNQNITVYKKPKDITYREVVSFIAQIAGSNAVIIPSGALKLKYYAMSPFSSILDGGRFLPWDGVDTTRDVVDGGSFNPWTEGDVIDGGSFTDIQYYHNLTATNGTTVSTDDIHFTGIMVSYEVVNSSGSSETKSVHYPDVTNWDDYAMQIAGNPFIETQAIANTVATSVWNVIAPLSFRVFSCSSIQDPTIEAGDCALVYDVKGNIYPTIITNVRFVTGGMTEVSCTAESPVKQNSRYVNPAAKAVQKAKENMDAYNTMVAHFNEIANQALGYKSTKISNVTYLYSGDTLASSANVVMISGNGIFISDNYNTPQRSWNSGVDITTATMLMNLIYVHGLTADWINAGTIDASVINVIKLKAGNITSGDIAADRIKSAVISAINSSTGSTVIDGGKLSITGIVNGINNGTTTINGGRISTNTITANQIASNAITADELKTEAVTSDKIKTGAVTALKISVDNLAAIKAKLGSVSVGGNDDDDGQINVKNASGTTKIIINNNGILAEDGTITVRSGGGIRFREKSNTSQFNTNQWKFDIGNRQCNCMYYESGNWHWVNGGATDIYWYLNQIISSDIRLKQDIEILDEDLSKNIVLNTPVYSFRFKSDPYKTHYGVIAQDLEKVLEENGVDEPVALLTKPQPDNDKYGVTYTELIPHMMNVLKTQQEEIDTLKQEVELLKQLVNAKQ